MKVQIQPAGLLVALFVGFLASALFNLSFAWCVVIGLGTIPALIALLSVFIWVADRPLVDRLERRFYQRKRSKEQKRIAEFRAERMAKREDFRGKS
jgi:hypothetical protein